MLTIQKILVPVAFSHPCAWAVRYACGVAGRCGAELLFLHVGEGSNSTRLEEFLRQQDVGAHRSLWLEGDPAERTVEVANQEAVSLILMPTHSYGRFRRFLLGSVTAKVLHDADCPVWTGAHQLEKAPPTPEFRSVLCAVDGGEGCVPVIRWALDLARLFGASLHAVHAIPAVDETSDNPGEMELCRYAFERASRSLSQLLREAQIDLKVALAGGEVARVVREYALRTQADLVVIGRGHTQRALGRLRTHAYSIIRNSPCPVLSI